MSNTYQKDRRRAQPDPLPGDVGVPKQVVVSMAEIIPRPLTSAGRGWITSRMLLPWTATSSARCWSPPGSAHLSSMR